jgi:hypothetical protein
MGNDEKAKDMLFIIFEGVPEKVGQACCRLGLLPSQHLWNNTKKDDIPKSTQEKNDERIRDCCICQGEEFCKPLHPSTSKCRGRVWWKSEFVVKARSYRPAQMRENAKIALRKTRRWLLWNSRHLCEGQSVLRLGWIQSGCHQTTRALLLIPSPPLSSLLPGAE